MRHCKSSAKGKVQSNTGIPQETRKKSNKKANYTPEATRKGEMNNNTIIVGDFNTPTHTYG